MNQLVIRSNCIQNPTKAPLGKSRNYKQTRCRTVVVQFQKAFVRGLGTGPCIINTRPLKLTPTKILSCGVYLANVALMRNSK